MEPPRESWFESVRRELAWHGVLAVAVAVFFVIFLRGFDARLLVLFGLPPTFAALHTGSKSPPRTRFIAWSFLVAIGLAAMIAHFPQVFPKLEEFEPKLPRWQNRTLMLYTGIYLTWLASVMPLHVFTASLQAHRRRQPAQFSEATCYLGIFTSVLVTLGLPHVLGILGFWPVI